MTIDEIESLLAMIVSNDKRTIGESDFALWAAAADQGHWTHTHARRALIEFITNEPDAYLRPGHITQRIAAARDRVRATWNRPTPPRDLADDPAAEIAWTRAHLANHITTGMTAWAAGRPIPEPAHITYDNPKRSELPTGTTPAQRDAAQQLRAFTNRTGIPQ